MEPFVLIGNYIWADGPENLRLVPRGRGVCDENGKCAGVFDTLPAEYKNLPRRDMGEALIVPGYSDLHTHAAQYRHMGLGMDLQLIGWLDELTYPEEARFRDADYARQVYTPFAEELRRGFTTRACIFASAHREGTEVLMELLDGTGLQTLVGKVNMDANAPDYIREQSAQWALADTERWLAETAEKYENTKPILTPRFAPSCTQPLLAGLGKLREKWNVPVQSHLDETPDEVAWVRELFPQSAHYAAVYDDVGLLSGKTVMAHCVYLTEPECAVMKERGSFIAHCPASNANVRSGIAPIRKYMDMGLNIGMGTDISGGHTLDMAETVRQALSASRLLWRMGDEKYAHLTAGEAFYLATAGGGAYFGKVGKFQPGYDFDAVAVDDNSWRTENDDLDRRFQKMIYAAGDRNVTGKYVAGKRLF